MTIEINEKELNESICNSIAKYGSIKAFSVYIGTAEDNKDVVDVKDNPWLTGASNERPK